VSNCTVVIVGGVCYVNRAVLYDVVLLVLCRDVVLWRAVWYSIVNVIWYCRMVFHVILLTSYDITTHHIALHHNTSHYIVVCHTSRANMSHVIRYT
jgi:hypothetical protein